MKTLKEANKLLGTNYKTWEEVSRHKYLTEEFIREFKDEIYWYEILILQKLSEDFIREFQDNVYWFYISGYQKLSEEFVREFQDKVNWSNISQYQKLSEEFIREFRDKVNWSCISKYQKLSEDFIKEFKDKVNWDYISKFQELSEEFIKEFDIKIPEHNWLYASIEEKIDYIKKNTDYKILYENFKPYIIAFKGVRSDNYSAYNFQYQYLAGGIYSSHCDCNLNNENSFGLSAWNLDKAKEYCNQKIIKVKIYVDNIGAIVHSGHKIRCFEFEVLEEV